MNLSCHMATIARVLDREAPHWLHGGHARARLQNHPRLGECVRIDIQYPEPAHVGVRFLPAEIFDHTPMVPSILGDVLRGAILVRQANGGDR